MDSDLENAYNLITDAVRAEDVFGDLFDPTHKLDARGVLDAKYEKLRDIVNPEAYKSSPDDAELAWDANEKLSVFYERAKARLADCLYGMKQQRPRLVQPGHLAFKTEKRAYYIGEPKAEGTIATVYEGECVMADEFAGRVAIKIVNDPHDNELMIRELRVLKQLHAKNGAQRKHLPIVLDQFKTNEGKLGTIFRYFDECYDLAMIHEDPNHRRGIDQKDMVWMLNRALSAVGYAHNNGILHGSIEPSHFVVRTRDHNVLFADWCWSVVEPAKTGDTFRIATPPFSAPEVEEKRAPTPAADIYSLGKCMIYVLGGDAETNFVPESVEDEIYRLLMYMVMESKLQRAQDAWQLHGYLNQLIVKLWGKRTFRHFQMSVDPL